MNKRALTGAISIALAMPWCASAQTPAPASKQAAPAAAAPAPKQPPAAAPAPKTVAPVTAAAPAAEPQQPAKRARRRVPSDADARACLEFQTNLQVIKCAEKYRWAS